jgi:hypothetical protein
MIMEIKDLLLNLFCVFQKLIDNNEKFKILPLHVLFRQNLLRARQVFLIYTLTLQVTSVENADENIQVKNVDLYKSCCI